MDYNVIHAGESDSPGYTRLLMATPVGSVQASELVTSETSDGTTAEIYLHGQREFDVPAPVAKVTFADGSAWQPQA